MMQTENNKVIAEFIGWIPVTKTYWINLLRNTKPYQKGFYRLPEYNEDIQGNIGHVDNFKFHTSWDWLMPVVEKIESDGFSVWFQSRKKAQMLVTIWKDTEAIVLYSGNIHETKIQTAHKAILLFITWYNTQQH